MRFSLSVAEESPFMAMLDILIWVGDTFNRVRSSIRRHGIELVFRTVLFQSFRFVFWVIVGFSANWDKNDRSEWLPYKTKANGQKKILAPWQYLFPLVLLLVAIRIGIGYGLLSF